jgi:peptidoglycan hydrolase-like protein with peptidoglycan-binding domain
MSDLKKGDTGDVVKGLQNQLINLGYNTCLVNGKIKKLEADGDFGEITEECLSSFQAKVLDALSEEFINSKIPVEYRKNLEVTGTLDFRTKYVIDNYDKLKEFYKVDLSVFTITEPEIIDTKSEIVNKILKIANENIGIVEKGGNNYGKEVEEYQSIGSNGIVDGGSPWCQYFMNYLLIKASEELNLDFKGTYSGYTPEVVNWGKKKGIAIINPKIEDIQQGDWGFVYSSARNSAKHVFIIEEVKSTYVVTIEGNTNPGGGADGFGVFRRSRPIGPQCWAIIRWKDLYI